VWAGSCGDCSQRLPKAQCLSATFPRRRLTCGFSAPTVIGRACDHLRGEWTLTIFGCTLQTVTTESDPMAAFRAQLQRCREELGLTYVEAGKRAGISGQRWRTIETGYEIKAGMRIPANPRRDNLIKMARAVEIPIEEALRLAGQEPLRDIESRRITGNPRQELTQLISDLPAPDVQLLLDLAQRLSTGLRTAVPDPTVRVTHTIVDTPRGNGDPSIPSSREGNDVTP
jgi:transcriptional regulator with XRE-family HTH domain